MIKNSYQFPLKQANARVRFSLAGIGMAGVGELHRDFHSTPDLAAAVGALSGTRTHRSQEELRLLPPPSHPPPPIPATLVKVDVKEGPEYGNIATADTNGNFF